MKRFLIVVYGPLAEDEAERKAGMAEMADWYQSLGASLLDPGAPFVAVRSVTGAAIEPGPIGPNASGYNIVQADSIAAAAELVRGCPLLKFGLSIAVYETFDATRMWLPKKMDWEQHHEPRVPKNLAGYLEAMTRIVFQAGMNWRVVQAKWPGIKRVFHGFDPKRVAAMTPREIDRIVKDPDVIRSRPKIEAVVHNARELVAIGQGRGGFRSYMRSLGAFDKAAPALRKRFHYIGEHGTYYFLWQVGESVPDWDSFIGGTGAARTRTRHRTSASPFDR